MNVVLNYWRMESEQKRRRRKEGRTNTSDYLHRVVVEAGKWIRLSRLGLSPY